MSHITTAGPDTRAQIPDFVADIARSAASSPPLRDGLEVQRVLDAVERSAATSSRWTRVNTPKRRNTRVCIILGVRGIPKKYQQRS